MKIFSIVVASLLLSGCGIFGSKFEDERPEPVLVTNRTYIAYECPAPPQIDNFEARDIEWDVASRNELDAIVLELFYELFPLEEDDVFGDDDEEIILSIINQEVGDFFFHPDDEVRWSLSADDYANLGRNVADILAAMRQMKTVILHYQQCIEDSKDTARRLNERGNTEVTEQ